MRRETILNRNGILSKRCKKEKKEGYLKEESLNLREESERISYLDERSSSEQDFSRVISLEREREKGREGEGSTY